MIIIIITDIDLIGTGGTGTVHMISDSGLPKVPCIHSKMRSSSVTQLTNSYTRSGVNNSY